MNEFEEVQKTSQKIINVLNESKLSGMTIYYMMKDILMNIESQLRAPVKEDKDEKKD